MLYLCLSMLACQNKMVCVRIYWYGGACIRCLNAMLCNDISMVMVSTMWCIVNMGFCKTQEI